MTDETMYVIWALPYDAESGQEAIGLCDLAEACELLRKPDLEIEWAVTHKGFIEANGYRCEADE